MWANVMFSLIALGDTRPYVLPLLVFLFMVWLLHRVEKRAADSAIYRNFPFFKEAVNSFQQKMDYLGTRIDQLEMRMRRLEDSGQGARPS